MKNDSINALFNVKGVKKHPNGAKEAVLKSYVDSLEHWAKCFRDGTLDDSFANEIAYLLEDKAHDLRVDDRHALSNKLITNALKRGDIK